ncbi:MAG: hypothetical protein K0R38_5175 [Polyangiaceae bacterium]|jgi:hypothetical protein|nr:hypothetical protein [Polyangiaceae bacterium]
MRARVLLLPLSLVATLSGTAEAQEDTNALQVHGFVSQGFIKSTSNNFLGPSARKQGSFDFTEVGINFTKPLGDKLRIGLQVFARDLGPLGNYTPQLDWYYVDYRLFDWLGVRVGKTKLPWGLYNEANDVDSGRVPILLPQSLYPVANRESLFAQTGGELYGDVPIGPAGSLEYRLYGGTIFVNTADASDALKGFEVPYEGGGRLMWRPPVDGLQLGSSAQLVRFDFDYSLTAAERDQYDAAGLLPADYAGTISAYLDAKLWVASVEYQHERLLLAAEYGRTYARYSTGLRAPTAKIVNEGGYLMASYQVASWFTPGLYYSAFFPDIHDGAQPGVPLQGRAAYQHDVAATLRYDLTANWLVKLEGHYMHGTAGLSSALNDNRPLGTLAKDWGVFLLKTTGYF